MRYKKDIIIKPIPIREVSLVNILSNSDLFTTLKMNTLKKNETKTKELF